MVAICADDIFKLIFFNENIWILIKISLKFVPKGPIKNNTALVQVMACRRFGDKPLSEPWTKDGLDTDEYMHHSASMSWATLAMKSTVTTTFTCLSVVYTSFCRLHIFL